MVLEISSWTQWFRLVEFSRDTLSTGVFTATMPEIDRNKKLEEEFGETRKANLGILLGIFAGLDCLVHRTVRYSWQGAH